MKGRLSIGFALIALGVALSIVGCYGDALRPLVPIGWAVWAVGAVIGFRQATAGTLSVRHILIVAVVLRGFAFTMPPTLSDDVQRYLWDGLVTLEGGNAFERKPSDPSNPLMALLRDRIPLAELNSPDYFTVYPATSQIIFSIGALGERLHEGWGIWTIKLAFGLCELAGLWLLSRIRGVRAPALLLYAWHPAVVVESWGQAHSEAAAVGLIVVCCWAIGRGRGLLAVMALVLAGWVKLHPLVLLPWLLAVVGWGRWWMIAVTSFVVWLPFWAPFVSENLKDSMDLYTGAFEFNAGLYEAVVAAGDVVLGRSGVLGGGGDSSKVVALLLQCILLGILPPLYAYGCRRGWGFPRAAAITYGLVLITTATIHPWYALPLLALIAVRSADGGSPGWHWQYLTVALSISYLFYTHGEFPYRAGMWLAWGGWLVLLISRVLKNSATCRFEGIVE